MDDPKDNPLRKAEASAKRVLERLGSAIDKKVLGRTTSEFGPDYAGDLASRIERLIESSLRADDRGSLVIAPNHYKVGLTYEETSGMTQAQIESLSRELTTAAHEFIHNRRYQTEGPLQVEVVADLFADSTTIKADFDTIQAPGTSASDPSGGGKTERSEGGKASTFDARSCQTRSASGPSAPATVASTAGLNSQAAARQCLVLLANNGRECRLDLVAGGTPLYLGRVAGNSLRLDDPSVSRVHCSVALRSDGQVVISDLDSANGTFVNGRVVNTGEAHKLEPGDDLLVGDVRLKVAKLEG
jgi:hypothetical protein